tara:strand:+ start:15258 stop:16226 length:969 start_codon:yes stop_codon:yes gene_type:complete
MKTLAFFTCTNGYGHSKRVFEVASYLKNDFDITVYASKEQIEKFNPSGFKVVQYLLPNILWKNSLEINNALFNQYTKWNDFYKKDFDKYDLVISDNLLLPLKYRKDTIIMGSFLWKDIFFSKFGINRISTEENKLLYTYKPLVITNKNVEIGSLREYKNKIQTDWGYEKQKKFLFDNIKALNRKTVHLIKPSFEYTPTYEEIFNVIANYTKDLHPRSPSMYRVTNKFEHTEDSIFVGRPGVGLITHCIEHSIPLLALFDPDDSIEIIELAQIVEDLNIGFKQNTKEPFNYSNFFNLRRHDIYYNKEFHYKGYKQIAEYIKKL